MFIQKINVEGLAIIEPRLLKDARGYLSQNKKRMKWNNIQWKLRMLMFDYHQISTIGGGQKGHPLAKETNKPKRETNIELYRIYCMFFIIFGHLYGYLHINSDWPFSLLTNLLGCCGVDGFVFITGYFLVNAKFKMERVFRVLIEATFYTVAINIVLMIAGSKEVTTFELLKSFWILGPTHFNMWFITKYLALLVIQPILSKIACSFTKRQYQVALAVILLLNLDFIYGFPFGGLFGGPWTLMWFVCIFFVAGYVRLYGLGKFGTSLRWNVALFFILGTISLILSDFPTISLAYNSPITFAKSVVAFLIFKNYKIRRGDVIHSISPHILSVYIIHQHWWLIPVITTFTASIMPERTSPLLMPFLLIVASAIFMACICIDKLRMLLFRYISLDYLINLVSSKTTNRISNFIHK